MNARAFALLGALLIAVPARADVDIERAGADAHGYTQPGQQAGFCSHPSKLAKGADDMCALADDTGCEGYKQLCKGASHESNAKAHDPDDDGSLGKLFGALGRVLLWVVLFAVALVAVWLVVQALRRAREDRRLADARPVEAKAVPVAAPELPSAPAITDAELLLRRASQLAASGDHKGALYTYLEAALRALDTRGAVRLAKDRTNGEYVRACKEPTSKAPLSELVREVDRVKFGGAQAGIAGTELAADRAARLVRVAVMLIGLLTLLSGCGQKAQFGRNLADDPSGTDVLEDLLTRQGIQAGGLRGSLARLPMPKEGEDAPAVMVDVDRTKIDDGTRAHLVEWVKAGGTLVLSGDPADWPKELAAKGHAASGPRVKATVVTGTRYDDEGDPVPTTKTYEGKVAHLDSLELRCDENEPMDPKQNTLAWIEADKPFAAFCFLGDGMVIGVANFDLFTNVGMMPPGNAQVAFAILSRLRAHELRIARPMDGIEPPSSPMSSIDRAGLGLGLWHALAAAIVLFVAVGVRLSRAAKAPPGERRAFSEHVEATGLVYARARAAPHALASFAKFADERLRAVMPRGVSDPAAFLAMRSGATRQECERVWQRATSVDANAPAQGDELDVLRRLTALYSAAVRR